LRRDLQHAEDDIGLRKIACAVAPIGALAMRQQSPI
jgi:hypothetical protein